MIRFQIPSAAARHQVTISEFKGVDLHNAPANVSLNRSPSAPNMIRDVPGKVRKRCGYHLIRQYPGRINGAFSLCIQGSTYSIVHAGTALYTEDGTIIYQNISNSRSFAIQLNQKLYFLDGEHFLCLYREEDTWQCKPVKDDAYVPTVLISRDPSGGGVSLEPFNLLQTRWEEDFLGQAGTTDYQLSAGDLDETTVSVEVLQTDGTWAEWKETEKFTVDRTKGIVHFLTAPGASPVSGKDNVKIRASRKRKDTETIPIERCRFGVLYGVGGASDRMFVSGNPDFPNRDWYSQQNDPSFFGDLWYSSLGQESGRIMGYSIINSCLAAHKDRGEDGRNIFLRRGDLENGAAAFPITNVLQGQGAISSFTFAYLSGEPLFLTRLGIFAVTPADVTGERYAQNRSFYLNKGLLAEPGLEDSCAVVFQDFYLLAVGDKVFILDGLVKSYEKDAPYSTYQYEGYYWLNIGARVLWEKNGALRFGREDGKVMEFYQNPEETASFQDDGKPIDAYWELPDFSGKNFFRKKTFRKVSFQLASAPATSVRILAQTAGKWEMLHQEPLKARYWDYSQLDYGKLTYDNDMSPKTFTLKKRLRGYDKVRFRLVNDQWKEPFGLYQFSVQFSETSDYRK